MKYQEKPRPLVVVEADKFERDNSPIKAEGEKFLGLNVCIDTVGAYVMVGSDACRSGNYIITHDDGHMQVVPAVDFEAFYNVPVVAPPTAKEAKATLAADEKAADIYGKAQTK